MMFIKTVIIEVSLKRSPEAKTLSIQRTRELALKIGFVTTSKVV